MRKVFIIILITSSNFSFSQEGFWEWNSPDNENMFDLYLKYDENNNLVGNYCSVFYSGKKIDCALELEEAPYKINLKRIEENVFEGKVLTNFDQSFGKLRLTYQPSQNIITFEIIKNPSGEFYLPNKVTLR